MKIKVKHTTKINIKTRVEARQEAPSLAGEYCGRDSETQTQTQTETETESGGH